MKPIKTTFLRFTLHLFPKTFLFSWTYAVAPACLEGCGHLNACVSIRFPSKPLDGSRKTIDFCSTTAERDSGKKQSLPPALVSRNWSQNEALGAQERPYQPTRLRICRLASSKEHANKSASPPANSGFATNCAVLQPARFPACTSISESPIIQEDGKSS